MGQLLAKSPACLELLLLLLLSLLACTRRHSVQIADVSRTNTLRLQSRHGEFVSGISLRLAGQLDGGASVWLNGGETQLLTGVVDWKTNQFLESSNCVLHYTPRDVRTGTLTVDYFFH
jgi:hypothetical protein